MKMKRTMETVDMKKVYEELMSLNNPTIGEEVLEDRSTVEVEQEMYEKQVHFSELATELLGRYQEFVGVNQDLVDNYSQFIRQTQEVHAFGKNLRGRNYVSLLNTISAMAYGVQTLKLEELVTTGYWGDLEVEHEQNPTTMGTAMAEG